MTKIWIIKQTSTSRLKVNSEVGIRRHGLRQLVRNTVLIGGRAPLTRSYALRDALVFLILPLLEATHRQLNFRKEHC